MFFVLFSFILLFISYCRTNKFCFYILVEITCCCKVIVTAKLDTNKHKSSDFPLNPICIILNFLLF